MSNVEDSLKNFSLQEIPHIGGSSLWDFHIPQNVEEALSLAGLDNQALAYKRCQVDTALMLKCDDCGHFRPVHFSCKSRYCLKCWSVKLKRVTERYIPVIKKFHSLLDICLTWGPTDNFNKEEWTSFNKAISKFIKLQKLKGTIIGREYGKENYSLHCHILAVGTYRDKHKITECWAGLSGKPITWIKKIPTRRAPEKVLYNAAFEVIKYVTKPASSFHNPQDLKEFIKVCHNRRFVSTTGYFYKIKVSKLVSVPVACDKCGSYNWRYDGYIAFSKIAEYYKEGEYG